jgi:hypothetical protein
MILVQNIFPVPTNHLAKTCNPIPNIHGFTRGGSKMPYNTFWLLLFIFITVYFANHRRVWMLPIGCIINTIIYFILEIVWIRNDMNNPNIADPKPDMDIIFSMGLAVRIVVLNFIQIPVMLVILLLRWLLSSDRKNDTGNSEEATTKTGGQK